MCVDGMVDIEPGSEGDFFVVEVGRVVIEIGLWGDDAQDLGELGDDGWIFGGLGELN